MPASAAACTIASAITVVESRAVDVVELADRRVARRAAARRRTRSRARSSAPGRARRRRRTSPARQVQKSPPSAWVRPRRARWKACECAFAMPGSARPCRTTSPSAAPAPSTTAVMTPSGVLDPDARPHRAVDDRVLEPERAHAAPARMTPRGRRRRRARRTPPRAPRASARRRSGCARTASPRARRRARAPRRRDPRPTAARAARRPRHPTPRPSAPRSNGVTAVQLSSSAGDASRSSTRAIILRTRSGSAPRASIQSEADAAIALTAPGTTRTRPTVPSTPSSSAARRTSSTPAAIGSTGSTRSSSAVVPAWFGTPAKSSRHRPCGQISLATPSGTPAPASPRAPPGSGIRPCSMCSSMYSPMRASRAGSAPDGRRVVAGGGHRLGERDARVVAQGERALGGHRAGEQPRPEAGDPEPRALLVREGDHRDRPVGQPSGGLQSLDGGERPPRPRAGRPSRRRSARCRGAIRSPARCPAARRPTTPTGCRCRRSRRGARASAARPANHSRSVQLGRRPGEPGHPARGVAADVVELRERAWSVAFAHRHAHAALIGDLDGDARSRRRRAGSRPSPGRC